MEAFFPNGESLIALEQETLRRILTAGPFTDTDFSNLLTNANAVYRRNVNSATPNFNFHSHFCIEDSEDARRVDVGVQIILNPAGTYNQVSYFFAVSGQGDDAKHILRKVHFDFEPLIHRNRAEPKPSLHFQVAGTLPSIMMNDGYTDSNLLHLAPWYEKPRIPALPFSLAILLDVLFHEFRQTTYIGRVLEDSTWRSLVKDAEMQMIYPYMKGCADFLGGANRDKLFVSHFLYGLDR